MASPKRFEGGCLCGHIRFVATGTPGNPHTCSCKMCQRHTGAITAVWAEFEKSKVEWCGPGGAPTLYRSSKASCRAFCSVCGSTVGAIDDEPVVALLVGTMDTNGSSMLKPVSDSFVAQQPRWWKEMLARSKRLSQEP